MDEFYVSIAGFLIRLLFKKDDRKNNQQEIIIYKLQTEILHTLAGFVSVVTRNPDFTITISETKDVERIKRKSDQHNFIYQYHRIDDRRACGNYQMSIWHFQSMLADILYFLLSENDGFGIHCSSVYSGNKAYLFLGNSGAGKSTIANLLNGYFQHFTDDIAFVRKIDKKYYLYQSPFLEKENNIKFPYGYEISQVFFLHKSNTTCIKRLKQNKIVTRLTRQVLSDGNLPKNIRKTVEQFASQDVFSELYFEKDPQKLNDVLRRI